VGERNQDLSLGDLCVETSDLAPTDTAVSLIVESSRLRKTSGTGNSLVETTTPRAELNSNL